MIVSGYFIINNSIDIAKSLTVGSSKGSLNKGVNHERFHSREAVEVSSRTGDEVKADQIHDVKSSAGGQGKKNYEVHFILTFCYIT